MADRLTITTVAQGERALFSPIAPAMHVVHPSAAITASALVTTETFCSA